MGLLDAKLEEDHSKNFRRILIGIVLLVLIGGTLWWMLRFHTEKVTVHRFLDAVIAGNTDGAYRIWKPSPSYSYKDFLDDWGPSGYYGPVKSFRLKSASAPKHSLNSVEIKVEVSPYSPFPSDDDAAAQSKTKEVTLWVDRNDQSMSFPP